MNISERPHRNHALQIILILVLVLSSSLFGAVAGGLGVYTWVQQQPTDPPQVIYQSTEATATQKIFISNTEVDTTITQVVQDIEPAVVTVVGSVSGTQTFFGITPDTQISGSGVIVSNDGYVITNNHVIENVKDVHIILNDGSELPAKVVSQDAFADIAVLKADGMMPAVAKLGNSDLLKPGETVIAIGSPLGDFRNSVTVGVISATGRTLDTGNGYQMENMIQTDAAINEGNSGGPLVNLAGEVIGINTLIVRGSGYSSTTVEALGFAISSDTAKTISEQIINQGYFARPYLGVQYQTITPSIARRYSLPTQYGAYITGIDSTSPANQAGLKVGDIITGIGDRQIGESISYINALFSFSPGDQVSIEFFRGNEKIQVNVTLGGVTN